MGKPIAGIILKHGILNNAPPMAEVNKRVSALTTSVQHRMGTTTQHESRKIYMEYLRKKIGKEEIKLYIVMAWVFPQEESEANRKQWNKSS